MFSSYATLSLRSTFHTTANFLLESTVERLYNGFEFADIDIGKSSPVRANGAPTACH